MSDVTGAGTAVSGIAQAAGAVESAQIAADAANRSADLQQSRYTDTRGDLAPFTDTGQSAYAQLGALNTSGFDTGQPNYLSMAQAAMPTTPQAMTQAQLNQTPGYQFQLAQGLQQTQNSAAARGLGVSGAALKGAATYATGLANNNYQQQFANQQALFGNQQTISQDYTGLNSAQQGNISNLYNRLSGTAAIGESAAAQTGSVGATLANQAGQSITAGGAASAAGLSGAGNALTGAAQNYLGYNALQQATATPTQTVSNPDVQGGSYQAATSSNDTF